MISDFAGGMVEQLVLSNDRGHDVLLIEGQNSILSPCYSGTAMSLVHGSCPDAMILCHNPRRTLLRHTDAPLPPLATYVDLYERVLAPVHPGKVVGIALNTLELTDTEASAAIAAASKETGLPVADVIREGADGCKRLADAVLAARAAQRAQRQTRAKPAVGIKTKGLNKKSPTKKTIIEKNLKKAAKTPPKKTVKAFAKGVR